MEIYSEKSRKLALRLVQLEDGVVQLRFVDPRTGATRWTVAEFIDGRPVTWSSYIIESEELPVPVNGLGQVMLVNSHGEPLTE